MTKIENTLQIPAVIANDEIYAMIPKSLMNDLGVSLPNDASYIDNGTVYLQMTKKQWKFETALAELGLNWKLVF